MPSSDELRPFSARFRCSQVARRCGGDLGVGEHVGVASDQLVGDAAGDVLDVEAALILGDPRVEVDLQEEVSQLLLGSSLVPVSTASTSPASSIRCGSSDACTSAWRPTGTERAISRRRSHCWASAGTDSDPVVANSTSSPK